MAKGRIYTKTGDKGQTSLFGGSRTSKASLRVNTYGTVDELNSVIGVIVATYQLPEKTIPEVLTKLQNDLFTIGSTLAHPMAQPIDTFQLSVQEMEQVIDEMTEKLPELHHFILPGGSQTGALFHLARTICRRTERSIVALAAEEAVEEAIIQYFNRLSDMLFTFARYVNMQEGKKEIIWKKA